MVEFEGEAVREGGDEASCEGRPRLREEDLEVEGATSRRTALILTDCVSTTEKRG